MPSNTLLNVRWNEIEGCGLFPRITLATKCETKQFLKKIIFLLQHHNNDRLNHFLSRQDCLRTQQENGSGMAAPERAHKAFRHPRPFFLFHGVPLFYLPRKLQFSHRKTKAMMSKYNHSSQNAILNPRNHLAALLNYENPFQTNTLN